MRSPKERTGKLAGPARRRSDDGRGTSVGRGINSVHRLPGGSLMRPVPRSVRRSTRAPASRRSRDRASVRVPRPQ